MADDDISRIDDFEPGQTIASGQVDAEFNQLVLTMNTKGGRGVANTWTAAQSFTSATPTTFSAIPTIPATTPTSATQVASKSFVDSLLTRFLYCAAPVYATSDTITVANFNVMDSTGTMMMKKTTSTTVTLASASINGRSSADTDGNNLWFNLYVLAKSDGTNPGLFLTTKNVAAGDTLNGLPSGYSSPFFRQLPFAIRNDGSANIIPFYVGEGWPYRPAIRYLDYERTSVFQVVNDSATSWTTVTPSSLIPPISRMGIFSADTDGASTENVLYLRRTGSSLSTGRRVASGSGTYVAAQSNIFQSLNSSQQFDYINSTGSNNGHVLVEGYVVTEVV
jgi:hypothetical protein